MRSTAVLPVAVAFVFGNSYVHENSAPACAGRIEAEGPSVIRTGGAAAVRDSAASGGYCASVPGAGSGLTIEHSAPTAERISLRVRSSEATDLRVQVFGPTLLDEALVHVRGGDWTDLPTVGLEVPPGVTTVTITTTTAATWFCDYIEFCAMPAPLCHGCYGMFAWLNADPEPAPWYAPWQGSTPPPTQGVNFDTALSHPSLSTPSGNYFAGTVSGPSSLSPSISNSGGEVGFQPGTARIDAIFKYADKVTRKYDGICDLGLCGDDNCRQWFPCGVTVEISGLVFLNPPTEVSAFCTVNAEVGGTTLKVGDPSIAVSASAGLDCGQDPTGDEGKAEISFGWVDTWAGLVATDEVTVLLAEELKSCAACTDLNGGGNQ